MKENKRNWIKAVILGASVLTVVGCGSAQMTPIHSEEVVEKLENNSALKMSWSNSPIPIFISDTVPERFVQPTIDAIERWNFEAGREIFDYQGVVESDVHDFDGANVIYWDETPHTKGYFGETHTQWIGEDVLVEADIVFHGKPEDFEELSCKDGGDLCKITSKKKDITTTALHELGHVVGFAHTDGEHDLMNPNFNQGDVRHNFDETLIAELLEIYNPTLLAEKR